METIKSEQVLTIDNINYLIYISIEKENIFIAAKPVDL